MSTAPDDPDGIPDQVRLFRRISPVMIVYDDNLHCWRPTSQNFQDSKDGTPMSVFAENVAMQYNERPEGFLQGRWSSWYLAAVRAGHVREHEQRVYLDPNNQDADDRFESHAAVAGAKPNKVRKKLSERWEWVIPPPEGNQA
jgi:hypothetical protein